MKRAVIACLFLFSSAGAGAEEIKIYLRSGTGFFVTSDGYIVTNKHVVEGCQRILVQGAIPPQEVKIAATDAEHDLAVLKADVMGADVVELRDSDRPVQKDERVVIIGYPGDAFKTGMAVTREAQVTSTKGPQGEDRWIELSDVVAQGNSGGPLFDTTGNVIGVVSAKAEIYTFRTDDPQHGTTSDAGIAISLPTLEPFLDQAGVRYRTSYAERVSSTDSIVQQAMRMIVNVRCEYKREVIQ